MGRSLGWGIPRTSLGSSCRGAAGQEEEEEAAEEEEGNMGGGDGSLMLLLPPLLPPRTLALLALLLQLVPSEEPVSTAGIKCNTIYKGFAGCLISLGDSMAQSVQQQQGDDEDNRQQQELDTICKSWDDFHICATQVLSSCPEEAASIWESLRQESRKIQFQGNLHDLCSSRAPLAGNGRASNMDETNKETLRGTAFLLQPSLWGLLLMAVHLMAVRSFA